MMLLIEILFILTLASQSFASENLLRHERHQEGDLEAVESRYRVDAKPEPYKPLRPAPHLDDDPPPLTTTKAPSILEKKPDKAEVLYPTTTYRPVNLYRPTIESEKFVPDFNKKKPSSESIEVLTKDSTGNSKRIKKVKKVLRNHAKNKFKNLQEDVKLDDAFSPPVQTTTKPRVTTTTLSPWRSRFSNKNEINLKASRQQVFSHNENPKHQIEEERLSPPQIQSTPSPNDRGRGSKVYLPDDSFADPSRSLPVVTQPTTPTPTTRWQQTDDFLRHSGDEELQSPKKSRGLPILSQLGNRPVTPIPQADHSPFFQRLQTTAIPAVRPLEVFSPEPPLSHPTFAPESPLPRESFTPEPFVPDTAFFPGSFAPEVDFSADPYSSETVIAPESAFPEDVFQPEPEVQLFNRVVPSPQPLQLFNHVAPVVEPERLVHPVIHQSVNEIAGSSQPISNVEENYDYDPDYESLHPRPYSFTYGVKDDFSGTDFSRAEERSGQVTKGSYQVALPDGRIQIVSYIADADGFKATVSYEGEAVYPNPAEQGSYLPLSPLPPPLPLPVASEIAREAFPFNPEPPASPPINDFEEGPVYDDYDEFVPLPPTPAARRPVGNRIPIAIITTPAPSQPSPTPSPAILSSPRSFLPTYPHFEPLYQEELNSLSVEALPRQPEPSLFESSFPDYSQPPTPTAYLQSSTFSPGYVTPSPITYSSSTTLEPYAESYSPQIFTPSTTFRPEFEYYGSQRKRQVNNNEAPVPDEIFETGSQDSEDANQEDREEEVDNQNFTVHQNTTQIYQEGQSDIEDFNQINF